MEKLKREVLVSKEAIAVRVAQIAQEIAPRYQDRKLLIIGVLKGSFIFLADLSRELYANGLTDLEIDMIQISSYGENVESSRDPKITKDLDLSVAGRHVLIIEDIIETGYSLAALQELLKIRGAISVETAVMLSKSSKREIAVQIDYVGFEVEDWIDGYGADTREQGRAAPHINRVIA